MHEVSIGINHAHNFTKCFRSFHTLLGFALYFMSSILLIVVVTIHSILTCTRIPCRDSHCENWSFEVLSFHPCRSQQTAVSCKRSNSNRIENNNKKFVNVVRLRFYPKTEHNGFPRSITSLCMHLHLSTFFELL